MTQVDIGLFKINYCRIPAVAKLWSPQVNLYRERGRKIHGKVYTPCILGVTEVEIVSRITNALRGQIFQQKEKRKISIEFLSETARDCIIIYSRQVLGGAQSPNDKYRHKLGLIWKCFLFQLLTTKQSLVGILIKFLALFNVDSLIKFLMLNALSEEAQHRGRPTYSLLTIRGEDGKIAREEGRKGGMQIAFSWLNLHK